MCTIARCAVSPNISRAWRTLVWMSLAKQSEMDFTAWHRGVWAGLFIDKSRFTLSDCNISMTSLVVGQWWSEEPNLRRDWQTSTGWATAHWVPFGIRMKSSDRLSKPPGPYAGTVGPGILLVLDNAQPHVARAWWQFLKDIIQFSFSYRGRNHNSSHLKSFYRMKELIP